MLGRLITPLRAAFDIPQRTESSSSTNNNNYDNVDEDAESFARDVRIELMRNAIDAFKSAVHLNEKIQVGPFRFRFSSLTPSPSKDKAKGLLCGCELD